MDREAAAGAGQLTLFDEPAPEGAGLRRRILLGGTLVDYRFERRRRQTIGIRIGEDGLAVAAPLRCPWREIEGFLLQKSRWILEKLEHWAAAGSRRALLGESGETLPVLGHERELEVRAGAAAVRLETSTLQIWVPEPQQRHAVRNLLISWLKKSALERLAPRVAHFAARLDLPAPPVALSRARTQWGVCMADGRIRLSWRLVHFDPELSDYVVAHEVAHLVELNHSERFWALVEWLYPHWRDARDAIERAAATLPRLQGAR
jgi:predicted metal-dependent hydrolase